MTKLHTLKNKISQTSTYLEKQQCLSVQQEPVTETGSFPSAISVGKPPPLGPLAFSRQCPQGSAQSRVSTSTNFLLLLSVLQRAACPAAPSLLDWTLEVCAHLQITLFPTGHKRFVNLCCFSVKLSLWTRHNPAHSTQLEINFCLHKFCLRS